MKHIWISGLRLDQIEEKHPIFRNLDWVNPITPPYSVHIFENKDNTGGIISLSDAFGGQVGWARYTGENKAIGKIMDKVFDKDETEFLQRKYPAFLTAINNLDA